MDLPEYKKENRKWLDRSLDISLRVLDVLDEKGMTQTELAQLMNVSRQYVSRILRGTENLTLETIAKLEEVLSIKLIEVVEQKITVTLDERNTGELPNEKEVLAVTSKQRPFTVIDTCENYVVGGLLQFEAGFDKHYELGITNIAIPQVSSIAPRIFEKFMVRHTCEASHTKIEKSVDKDLDGLSKYHFILDVDILSINSNYSHYEVEFVALRSGEQTFGLVIPDLGKINRKRNQYLDKHVFNG